MKPFYRILKYIFNYKILFVIALLCSMIYASMNAFSVYLIGPFLEQIFKTNPEIVQKIEQQNEVGKLKEVELYLKETLRRA